MRLFCLTLLPLCLILPLSGCQGDGKPEVAPTTGVVTYDGEPVAKASVAFVPMGEAPNAIGTTDDEGRFTLTTFNPGDGAVVGAHRVIVVPHNPNLEQLSGDMSDPNEYLAAVAEAEAREKQSSLPPRYASVETTDLTVTVKPGTENELSLKLTDEPG